MNSPLPGHSAEPLSAAVSGSGSTVVKLQHGPPHRLDADGRGPVHRVHGPADVPPGPGAGLPHPPRLAADVQPSPSGAVRPGPADLHPAHLLDHVVQFPLRVARPQQQQAALGAGHAQLLDGRPALAARRGQQMPVGLVRIDVVMVRVGAKPGDTDGGSNGYGWIVG